MNRVRIATGLTVLILLAGSSALLLRVVMAGPPKIITGTLTSLNPQQGTVGITATGEALETTLSVSRSTALTIDNQAARGSQLKVGMYLSATYDSETLAISRIRAFTEKPDAPAPRPRSTPATEPKMAAGDGPRSPGRSADAADGSWPQWRGVRQDGISTETGLLATWPASGPKLVWEARVGEGFSSMAVADGKVLTLDQQGNQQFCRAYDAESGREAWATPIDTGYENGFGNGPRATPTVDGDRVFAQGSNGSLVCLDLKSGREIWRRSLFADLNIGDNLQWGISASPVVLGDLLLVNPGAAYDKKSGKPVWRNGNDRPGYATPLLFEHEGLAAAAIFTSNALVGIDTANRGRELFRFPWQTDYDCNIATPIYANGSIFISTNYGKGCALLRLSKRDNDLTHEQVYVNKEMKAHFQTPVLVDGHLYGFDDAFLVCLEMATGEQKWKERGFQKGALTLADGKLIILGEQGVLALAEPSPAEYKEISKFSPLSGKCWSAPVVAGGRVYIRNEQVMKAFALR